MSTNGEIPLDSQNLVLFHMNAIHSIHRTSLEDKLNKTRHDSLIAMRKGDFRAVAKLTSEAARLNRAIIESDRELRHHSQSDQAFPNPSPS